MMWTVHIPFSPFQKRVLRYLKLAPYKLTPNVWGFLKTFKIVMRVLNRDCTIKVFFSLFEVFRQPKVKSARTRQGHVGLRCNQKQSLFVPVTDSVKDLKFEFFYVRSLNVAAKREVVELDEKDEVVESWFSLSWIYEHFKYEGSKYACRPNDLPRKDART